MCSSTHQKLYAALVRVSLRTAEDAAGRVGWSSRVNTTAIIISSSLLDEARERCNTQAL